MAAKEHFYLCQFKPKLILLACSQETWLIKIYNNNTLISQALIGNTTVAQSLWLIQKSLTFLRRAWLKMVKLIPWDNTKIPLLSGHAKQWILS